MLLLLRLTAVASDDRLDLRNSAIQTLLRIFDAYGDRLSPEAWSICIKAVVFKLLSSLREELEEAQDDDVDDGERAEWHGTAVVVLDGISTLLGNYLDVLTVHPSFNQLWNELLEHLAALLDFRVLDINTATFKALGHVLSQTTNGAKPTFNETTIKFAWDLWCRGIPISKPANGKSEDNHNCLIAYVAAFREVYRLIQNDLTADRVRRILTLLRETVEEASVGTYASDVENMTPLQSQVLSAVQMIRTDVKEVPSAIIIQVSEFIALAYKNDRFSKPNQKRTYVAMSKASMQILETYVSNHAGDKDIYQSGGLSAALSALCRPIALKYEFPIAIKSVQPWKLANSVALAILQIALPHLDSLGVAKSMTQDIWSLVASIADGILSADCASALPGTNLAEDEAADIAWFRKLIGMIIPLMGSDGVSDKTRKAYAESLFKTSIIHEPTSADQEIIHGDLGVGISALYTPRVGRTVAVPPTQRTQIAYVAFEELFSLVSSEHSSSSDDTPNPKSPTKKHNSQSEAPSVLELRIARTAAPYLILRCALTIRSYSADQPLRGKMPQPLSQRKELIWTLQKLVNLKSHSEAIPALTGADSDSRKHLLRLYPLVVKALGVAKDEKVLELLREALEVVGGELGIA